MQEKLLKLVSIRNNEFNIKTTILHLSIWLKWKIKQEVLARMENRISYVLLGNIKVSPCSGKTIWHYLLKSRVHRFYISAGLPLGVYARKSLDMYPWKCREETLQWTCSKQTHIQSKTKNTGNKLVVHCARIGKQTNHGTSIQNSIQEVKMDNYTYQHG